MTYKFDLGDLVFFKNSDCLNKGILHITEREFKKFDEDIVPHKYYHGFAFSLAKDEKSGLYVPLCCIDKKVWGPTYKSNWEPNIRETELETINSKKVDLQKLFPYITELK
ncbi:MAG TPA: hypothetical protein VJB35_02995 [Candidatus Nanoarchaeia archaeon]|nr:hypothetical protein [Candidatus Nanoarchaeia archaeon]